LHHSLFNLNISHGTANKSFHKSNANFDVISVHDFFLASITITPTDNQATISFLTGKLYGFQTSHIGKIEIIAQLFQTILLYNFLLDTG
jgi:hypothetical protein